MRQQACRPAARRAEQSVGCEDHRAGRSSGDASVELPPLADERIDRCPEDRMMVAVGLQQIGPGQAGHQIVVHPADLEEGTAAAVGQAEAGHRGRTEELPGNRI